MEKRKFSQVLAMVALCACLAPAALAEPLGVNIIDHDFLFHVPYYQNPDTGIVRSAVYDYNGAAPDSLSLTVNSPGTAVAGTHNVGDYTYSGQLLQVPPNPQGIGGTGATPPVASPWLYPLFFTIQHGAKLEIQMDFNTNDGPYTNPTTGDRYDVSLTGQSGFLRITGWIGSQGWPAGVLYPDVLPGGTPNDITLLEIEFKDVSLLARAGASTADLIEGAGEVKTLLGWDMQELAGQLPELAEMDGVTFFKFMLPDTQAALFPLPGGESYNPMNDYGWDTAYGGISGEAGLGDIAPEPATMTLLGIGALGLLRRRRK